VADQTRRLCIVSRDRLDGRDFLAAVQASVQPEDYLEVIVDRRRGEPSSQWHGANDRRKRPHVDLALLESGVAIVPAATPADDRRREPASRGPSPRDRTSGQRFEDRLVDGEIPQEDWSASPARDPFSQRASSRFASRVVTAPDDYRPEPYESSLDDDTERLKAIRGFSQRLRREEHPPRSRLPWIIAVLAIAVALVAALIALSPLGNSLKQAFKQSLAVRRSSETSRTASEASRTASETPPASSSRAPSATPRATEPAAGGEPSPVPSRDTNATSPRDNRELAAANSGPAAGRRAGSSVNEPSTESAPAAPQTSDGTTGGRRPRPSVSEPAPRRAALPPAPEPVVPPSESTGRLMTSPRFPDLPRVDVSRESGGIYSARIVDPAGRPLTDADVLLLARMSDGTVENVMMQFSPDRGVYRGALPATRSSIVYLRLRVITGNKRIEIPVEP
jgi:hypothetical protein